MASGDVPCYKRTDAYRYCVMCISCRNQFVRFREETKCISMYNLSVAKWK